MDSSRLQRIVRRQSGLFTKDQARSCGFSAKQILHRVASGRWQSVIGRVLAEAGLQLTPIVRDRAAQLAVPGSVLAGPSAARAWGIAVPDGDPCLAVGRANHPSVAGIRFLRIDIMRRDIGTVDGIPTTWRERTVFDCLCLLPEEEAFEMLERALQQRWLTFKELTDRVRLHVGRREVRRLLRFVRRISPGARSAAERLLTRLLMTAKIGGWVANAPIVNGRGPIGIGDVIFESLKLVIEVDGWAFHTTPERFHHDRERQNRLVAAGWTVLRFTWRDLTERPQYVIATIRAMLARLGAAAA